LTEKEISSSKLTKAGAKGENKDISIKIRYDELTWHILFPSLLGEERELTGLFWLPRRLGQLLISLTPLEGSTDQCRVPS
jgi:hypothetical protein